MSGHHKLSTRHKIELGRYARSIGLKNRTERQIGWLIYARQRQEDPKMLRLGYSPSNLGINLHISGGVGYDKDLRELVENDYLAMKRVEYDGSNTRKHGYRLSRSVLVITDAGREYLRRLGR